MKNLIFSIMLLAFAIAPFGASYAQADVDGIVGSIKSGNADALGGYFASNVDLLLGGDEGTVSKSEAIAKTKRFFAANSPKGFAVKHQGDKNGSQYIVGTLNTSGGSYRTYIVLRSGQIVELCIE